MGWLGRVLSGTTLAVALLACSSGNEEGRGGGGGGIGPGGGSGGLGGTGSFGGGTGSFGGGTGGFGGGTGGVTGTDGGPIDDPNVCGGDTVEPEIIEVTTEVEITRAEPIAIYIMLDQSGSMITLWPGAVQAITDFVNDPQSAGLDVALGLFPPPNFGDGCLAGSYNPPPVPLGRLPGHAGAITGGLPGGPVGIGTPIEGALKGATEFCRNFTPADPADAGEQCIVLFITDGAPSGCAEDTPSIVSVAQNGGVPVYTIALQGVSDLTLLNMIASVTGTTCGGVQGACDLRNGASFADTLAAIRDDVVTVETVTEQVKQALTCEWGIPAPSEDMPFDKDLVNVIFTATPGGAGQTFANVPGEADCAGNAGAWYYDNPDDPQRIHACPQTCTTLEASPDGAVDIQLGCPIVVVE